VFLSSSLCLCVAPVVASLSFRLSAHTDLRQVMALVDTKDIEGKVIQEIEAREKVLHSVVGIACRNICCPAHRLMLCRS
jgi:hypothetical protein